MSVYESGHALFTQTNTSLLHTAPANFGKRSVRKITWHNNDGDIAWGQHISDISSKATKTLGFLRWNLVFVPRGTKEVAYKSLVRPKLEYAHIVKLRFSRWRRYRGWQPAGPAGETQH